MRCRRGVGVDDRGATNKSDFRVQTPTMIKTKDNTTKAGKQLRYDANADEILSQSSIIILKKTKMMKAALRKKLQSHRLLRA